MDNQELYKTYLKEGTAGYAVIRKFYFRYTDLLVRIHLADINDVVHEVFLSLSKTDFTEVKNIQHYTMRAIKLHCWSLLDKAMKMKTISAVNQELENLVEQGKIIGQISPRPDSSENAVEIEGMELLAQVNLFKSRLNQKEIRLLNMLIEETDRFDIAASLEMNLNTLDTNIRRLRMKLAEYLKSIGYSYTALEKFS